MTVLSVKPWFIKDWKPPIFRMHICDGDRLVTFAEIPLPLRFSYEPGWRSLDTSPSMPIDRCPFCQQKLTRPVR